ncbi:DUF3606 domain-containing protein (plasmid) [Novosphingobium resinovorum]|uniref:DUF3606 domain-containing protein n=1 Tax=Novosphingobium TaxID=165696 RepID=UPI001B3C973D|nr:MULTISPECIES: DUF3606 domain-containing protein [Novosphingobium]MBF7015424.1 DUF3606 domain-containing protein [Novosphingobium sp. HR1a]WJM30102.1 DUF3606 domain-containing protein [Novosphingobium resinovorum]
MADDKSQRGEPDRSRVAGDEEYEVDYFAQKHGLTRDQVQELINRHGNNREKLDAEAAKIAKG